MFQTYHPLNQSDDYFFKSAGTEKCFLLDDSNAQDTEPHLSKFLERYATKIVMREKT